MAGGNILVIEDDPNSAEFLDNALRKMGYRVWLVERPAEGLKVAQNTPLAVVITELRSAWMNGVELTKAMCHISPHSSVLVITAYSFIGSAVEAMEVGAFGYITKPFNISEIKIMVERAIEKFYLLSSEAEKSYYEKLSIVDGLTGVYNHRYFKVVISREVQRLQRYPTKLALLMIDIDNFKNYNDTQGHIAGDELLHKVAQLLKTLIREIDVVFRYGGEEFVIMLLHTDKKGAEIVAERLRVQVTLFLPITISIGIATFPDDAQNQKELIEKADSAMYKAKQTGKNRYCVA